MPAMSHAAVLTCTKTRSDVATAELFVSAHCYPFSDTNYKWQICDILSWFIVYFSLKVIMIIHKAPLPARL